MKTPTIYEIKYDVEQNDPGNVFFFSRNSMKFFGQTLRDFSVRKSPTGRIFIMANMYLNGRVCGFTFREYKDHTLVNLRLDNGSLVVHDTFESVLSYIETH